MEEHKVRVRVVYEWEYGMRPENYLGETNPLKMLEIDRRFFEENPEEFIDLFQRDPKEASFTLVVGNGDAETAKIVIKTEKD